MPSSRRIPPEGAPAELFDFFQAHPGSTMEEAMAGLGLNIATAYRALTRLYDARQIEKANRQRPARWRVKPMVEAAASPAQSPEYARAAVDIAAAPAYPFDFFIKPIAGTPTYRFTGTPIARAGEIQCIRVGQS